METKPDMIRYLSEDIPRIIMNFYGEKYEMVRLCKDHRDPYLYFDEKPVLEISQDEFVGIFDMNSSHYFLHSEQVVRLGVHCKLDLPNLIAIILKTEWEQFLSQMSGYSKSSGLNLASLLKDPDLIRIHLQDFKPDTGKIYNLIKDNTIGSGERITYSQTGFFIRDLLEDRHFLIENMRIGELYPGTDITEKILLNKVAPDKRELYIRMKERWKEKSTELDDLLLYFERKKRLNMGIENKYLRTFGQIENEKSRTEYQVKKYKIILAIISEQPGLSYRELFAIASEKMIDAERERNELKNKMARSHNYISEMSSEGSLPSAPGEFRNAYTQACKKLLRELFFLLHTDTCPNYSGLSKQKKAEINKLWLKLMKSTKEEMYSYSPAMMLYSMPDYYILESIYRRACEILEINPNDFELGDPLEFMIRKGSPMDSILEFLMADIEQLELHLAHLELVQNEYTHEEQSRFYRNALANMSAHSDELRNVISELNKEIIELKKEISGRIKKVVL